MKDPPGMSKPCPPTSADQATDCNAGTPDVAANTDDPIMVCSDWNFIPAPSLSYRNRVLRALLVRKSV